MSPDLPHLLRADIEKLLGELYATARQRHVFALYGTGELSWCEVPGVGRVEIVPVRSELELRKLLPAVGDEEKRMVFLVPWTHDIPLDVQSRFALNGRVKRLGREAQLRRLFGVVELESELVKSPLVELLLRPGAPSSHRVPESRLTADLMWGAFLQAELGLEVAGGLALDLVLGFAAANASRSRAQALFADERGAKARDALLAHLAKVLGPAGPVVWKHWEDGRGAVALECAVALEALAAQPSPEVAVFTRSLVRRDLGVSADKDVAEVAVRLAESAAGALRLYEKRAGEAAARALVRAAEQRLDDPVARRTAAASVRLPLAWRARLDRLGEALEAAVATMEPDGVRAAQAALRALEDHAFFKEESETRTVRRGEMALRLLAWLVARPDRRLERGLPAYAEVEALGRWYAEEGGYVDWARRTARGPQGSPFDRGVAAVVRAADAARTALDRTFARALAAWVEAGRPSQRVLPIDQAVSRLAVRFLEEQPERRLLVMLCDGMAWAQAVELLGSLGERAIPWGPLAWHGTRTGRHGEGFYPVVLANLPTVTDVSRSAFFAGKEMPPGKVHDTQKDPQRWKANPAVARLFEGMTAPQLLLRSDGHTRAGGASSEALTMIGDPERRIVALVVNAIDDGLKANPAVHVSWEVDAIASMYDLLEKARESGRAVLLASDHGHVPADRLEHRGPPVGGARWRPWMGPGDAAHPEHEVAFPVRSGVWAPQGAQGVVLLADDESRYGTATHAGEHGGATLAEVVAPCLLIGSEDLGAGVIPDPALSVRAAYVPAWWHGEVEAPLPVEELRESKPKKPPVPESQLALIPAPPPATAPPSAAESAFAKSEVLAKLVPEKAERAKLVRLVDFLAARPGVASRAQLAAALGELPRRVPGVVAAAGEKLNLDGYAVLSFEAASDQVRLDLGKLRQLFELGG